MNSNDDKIVVMGMSCSGKTAFAKTLDHTYYCFDALFPWHEIETFGLSIQMCLISISKNCVGRYVLDGWHLADKSGVFMPPDSTVYVVYRDYYDIIAQYRVPVEYPELHVPMFKQWYYDVDYTRFPRVRYVENTGSFVVRSQEDFTLFLERNRQTVETFGIQGSLLP